MKNSRLTAAGALLAAALASPWSIAAETSPADAAYAATRAAVTGSQVNGTAALDTALGFYFGYPEDKRLGGLLVALANVGSRLPAAEQGAFWRSMISRLEAGLAKGGLSEARREDLLAGLARTELALQQAATQPDAAAARRRIDALATQAPAARPLGALEAAYARLLDRTAPKSGDAHLARLVADPKATDAFRESLLIEAVQAEIAAQVKAEPPVPGAIRARIDTLRARFPQARMLGSFEMAYAKVLGRVDPAAGEAQLKQLAAADPATASKAAAELRLAALRTQPMEMAFTAADGREVDLAKLRGKVVLIDFWATWCGPCVAEIPNLRRVYEAYHDQGFEVIGISFDKAPTAAQAKFERDREAVLAYVKENRMPWPQYYDGAYWDNKYGRMYGIGGIPAMFLLDQEGRLVDTNARGERLEPMVRKLLGLK